MWCSAPSVCKWNKIINFVLSLKLKAKIHFLQDPQNPIFSTQIIFFTFYRKKLRNKYLPATNDYYFIFKTFFSQVNNKGLFLVIHPLNHSGLLSRNNPDNLGLLGSGRSCEGLGDRWKGVDMKCIIWNAIWKLVTACLKEKVNCRIKVWTI